MRFLIVKEYFVTFLEKFDAGCYEAAQIKLHHRVEVINDYRLFHLPYSVEEKYVDYRNSEFLIGKIGDWRDISTRTPVYVEDYRSYTSLVRDLRERNDNSEIRCHKLVLNPSKAREDIFRLGNMPFFGSGYYVSERLKSAIEERQFTGIAFKEISEVDGRIHVH